jgi:hypothetical protein
MMRVVTVAAAAVFVMCATIEAGAVEGAACPSRKVKATGKKVDRKLKCHDKAASLGITVDPLCLAKAETKFADDFSRADTSPPCFATGDAAAIEADVDVFVDGLVALLRPSPAASRCAGKKLKAAGKKASKRIACHQHAIQQGTRVGPECLDKETVKFSERFAAAEERPDCLTTGDTAATEAAIDDFVDQVIAVLRPVTPSKCTTQKLVAAGRKGREKLACHASAANGGSAVSAPCLVDAETDFADAFADGEAAGDCYTTGDGATVEALVDDLVDDVEAQLRPVLTTTKCAAGKLLVSGRAYERLLRCRAGSVDDGLPLLPDCVADANQQITVGFPEFEDDPDCLTTGDAVAVLAALASGVSSVEGALLP